MDEATSDDIQQWARLWFETCNVNTLYPEISVADGKITTAAIRQTAPESHPVLRPHTLNVGLYGNGDDACVQVRIDGERTELPELVGRPAPEFLLLNDGDLTYAKVRFDERSLAALPGMLPRLSPINRGMVWAQLLQAIGDAAFPPAEHLALVADMVTGETELSIIHEVLEQARYDVADRYLQPAERPKWLATIADRLRSRLADTPADDERLLTLFRYLIEFSSDVEELRGLLAGIGVPAGVELDNDTSWRIRYRLAVLGEVGEDELETAYRDEPSAQAEQLAVKARASRPYSEAKRDAWEAIVRDPTLSNYQLWSLAEGFWQPEQAELTAPYVERFFAEMPDAAKLRGDLALDVLLRFFYPRYAASEQTLELAAALVARDDISLPLRRRVADFTDDLRRVVQARATYR